MKSPHQLRILVADDHALMRRGIRDLLHDQQGWKVVGEAASGSEALDKARKMKPDVAILDVTMPDPDGLETTRQLREAVPDTKILILTMHESRLMMRRILEAGASGYVLKSDFPRCLIDAVKHVSRDEQFLSPRIAKIVLNGFLESSEEPQQAPVTEPAERNITPRELQIVSLLAAGKANKEIAVELGIAVRTVETHGAKIMLKLGFTSLAQVVQYAVRNGLIAS